MAVAAGIGAVALAQSGSLDPPTEPMSEESVLSALAEAESSTPAPQDDAAAESTPPASPEPTGQLESAPSAGAETGEEVFGGDGGTFLASCEGSRVRIEWWAPAQGWKVSNVDTAPGEDAEIEFESESDEEEYSVMCVGGVPQLGSAGDDATDDDGDDG